MTRHEIIEQKAEALILPLLPEFSCTLVDTEYVREAGNYYLRYYIDKEGGVTILDCENVSRAVSPLLDEPDFIGEPYTLEVSSPGLGRPLKKDKDYIRNLGKPVEIRLFKEENGAREFTGVLEQFDRESVSLLSDTGSLVFTRKNLSLIREYVDWDEI